LTPEKKAEHEADVARLTQEILDAEASGSYALHLYFERAYNLMRLGHLRAAFEDYLIVSQGDPGNETAWNNMAELMIDMGDPIAAEGYFVKAIEAYPADSTYNQLYEYYMQYRTEDRMDVIGRLLENQIAENGGSVPAYVHLAEWYLAQGNTDKALEYYRQAIQLDPENEALKEEMRAIVES
jgi:tetratricopeptide (TPR) repeat protein